MKRAEAMTHKPEPIRKERNVLFAKLPPGQVTDASTFLASVDRLEVEPDVDHRCIGVAYDLREHTLQEIEATLEDRGYHLETALLNKMMRALIHYIEETQLHNLEAPDRPLKKSQNEAYTHAWERHPHGDHDDTPPEWREYK